MEADFGAEASVVRVVGVAVNTEIDEGLRYLQSFDLASFDQISLGSGWQNEHIARVVWRDSTIEASAPQVIIVARRMKAQLKPLTLQFSPDSVVKVLVGATAVREYVLGTDADRTHVLDSPKQPASSQPNTNRSVDRSVPRR